MSAKSYARRLERRAQARKMAAGQMTEAEAAEFKAKQEAFAAKKAGKTKKE